MKHLVTAALLLSVVGTGLLAQPATRVDGVAVTPREGYVS